MPAESRAQQIVMAIAEHHPEKLHKENRGLLKMSHKQLHEFASTPRHNLPSYVRARNARKGS
jgi:hypothetical protein